MKTPTKATDFIDGRTLAAIRVELCAGVPRARPDHPQLCKDVERAVLIAVRSPIFRRAIREGDAEKPRGPDGWRCPAISCGGYSCELRPDHEGEHASFLNARDEQGPIQSLRWANEEHYE